MTDEQRLIEKLQFIETLFAGAAPSGERVPADQARERIRARLREQQQLDPPVEFQFAMRDQWSRHLFIALLRRYGLRPYRYPRQRQTTVMARVPQRFVHETLWPEFNELNKTLFAFLAEATKRVLAEALSSDQTEIEIQSPPAFLGSGLPAPDSPPTTTFESPEEISESPPP